MSDDDLPFRCRRCGAFVGQERLQEADDFGPAPCKSCKRLPAILLARDVLAITEENL